MVNVSYRSLKLRAASENWSWQGLLGEFNDSFHALPGSKSAPQQKIRLIFALSLLGQAWLDRVTTIYSGFRFSEAQ
jgi:hypothetical protein